MQQRSVIARVGSTLSSWALPEAEDARPAALEKVFRSTAVRHWRVHLAPSIVRWRAVDAVDRVRAPSARLKAVEAVLDDDTWFDPSAERLAVADPGHGSQWIAYAASVRRLKDVEEVLAARSRRLVSIGSWGARVSQLRFSADPRLRCVVVGTDEGSAWIVRDAKRVVGCGNWLHVQSMQAVTAEVERQRLRYGFKEGEAELVWTVSHTSEAMDSALGHRAIAKLPAAVFASSLERM